MSSPERIYHGSVKVLSFVFIGLGVAILGSTLARGGGPLSLGVLLGIIFIGVGCGRLYVASRTRSGP
jgi:hypothetical protein